MSDAIKGLREVFGPDAQIVKDAEKQQAEKEEGERRLLHDREVALVQDEARRLPLKAAKDKADRECADLEARSLAARGKREAAEIELLTHEAACRRRRDELRALYHAITPRVLQGALQGLAAEKETLLSTPPKTEAVEDAGGMAPPRIVATNRRSIERRLHAIHQAISALDELAARYTPIAELPAAIERILATIPRDTPMERVATKPAQRVA